MTRLFTTGFETGSSWPFYKTIENSRLGITTASPRTGDYQMSIYVSYYNQPRYTYAVNLANMTSGYEIYYRFYLKPIALYNTCWLTHVFDNAGNARFNVWYNGGIQSLSLDLGSFSWTSWTADKSATHNLNISDWNLVEIYAKLDATSGRHILKLNGIQEWDYTGNSGSNPVGILYMSCVHNSTTDTSTGWYIDDFAVNDTSGSSDNSWCSPGRVVALRPTSSGDSTQWTPSSDGSQNYTMVDERPPDDDTTFVYVASSGQKDLYNCTDCGLSNVTILRVWPQAHGKSDSGTQIKLGLKQGGTEYWDSTAKALPPAAYGGVLGDTYTTDPYTTSAWTTSGLDSLQVGIQSV